MNSTDEILSIDTPENVIFGYRLAGLGSRFLAALIDSAIIVTLQALVILTTIFLFLRSTFNNASLDVWAASLLGFIAFLFFWGYYIFFELNWNGQSPGKRMVGIRVLRADGTPVTLSEVLIRNLVRMVDFLPSFYGLGVVVMFVDERSRRLGDLAAGTLVVHDSGTLSLENLAAVQAAQAAQTDLPDFPVSQLTNADLQFLEEYISRRRSLGNRLQLGQQVLRKLYLRVGMTDQPLPEDPDILLNAILAGARSKTGQKKDEDNRHSRESF
ncbi:MAG: RDD family protein [Anaerolineales bacterium]|nr:RDD family protein [Anaerolineales bacterium]